MALDDDAVSLRAGSHEGDRPGVERCVQAARTCHLSALSAQARSAGKRVLFHPHGDVVERGGDGGQGDGEGPDAVCSYDPGSLLFSDISTDVGTRGFS